MAIQRLQLTVRSRVQYTLVHCLAFCCFATATIFFLSTGRASSLPIASKSFGPLGAVTATPSTTALSLLYSQFDVPGKGEASNKFTGNYAAFSSQGADDFQVPSGEIWSIHRVSAAGLNYTRTSSFNIFIYSSSNSRPAAQIYAGERLLFAPGLDPGEMLIELELPPILPEGTYWLSVQAVASSGPPTEGWFWSDYYPVAGNSGLWRNPEDGYGTGCVTWCQTRPVGMETDRMFRLWGNMTIPTSTPTFTPSPTPTPSTTPTPTSCVLLFDDVAPNSTFYTYVRCLSCRGIVQGYADGTFRPNNPVTRGQLAKFVSQSAGFSDIPGAQQFEDVPVGSTFYAWVWRLAHREIMGGYACGGLGEPCGMDNSPYFRPSAEATRGQLTKIVSNALDFQTQIPTG